MLFCFAVRYGGSDSGGTVYFTCRTSVPFAPCICFYQFADGFASGNCDWHGAGRYLQRKNQGITSAGILTGSFLGKIGQRGALIACPVMTSYYIGLQQSTALAATMFTTRHWHACFMGLTAGAKVHGQVGPQVLVQHGAFWVDVFFWDWYFAFRF